MKKEMARQIIDAICRHAAELDSIALLLKEECPEEEFKKYRRGIGYVMGYGLTEIMNPIFKEHPDLIPPGLKESYNMKDKQD